MDEIPVPEMLQPVLESKVESTDRTTVRLVVVAIALLALVGLIGTYALVAMGTPADRVAIFVGIAGPPIGGLCTMLVSTRTGGSNG